VGLPSKFQSAEIVDSRMSLILLNQIVLLHCFAALVSAVVVFPTSPHGSRMSSISAAIAAHCLQFGIVAGGRKSLHIVRYRGL
jgi:hypothetical protein